MPLYSYRCGACGAVETAFRKIAEREDSPLHCGAHTTQVIEAPTIIADLPGYQSPIDGRWVEGRRARTEDLKRSNCRPWEGMANERSEAVKRAEAADHVFEQKTEAGLHETFNNMSAEKQRVLAAAIP